MKILFYTRLEGDTGGDETFLNTLQFYLLQNLKKGEGTEVHLCLSYDLPSKARALKIEARFLKTLEEKGLDGTVWLFFTNENCFEKSVLPVKSRYLDIGRKTITDFQTALPTLDAGITWYIKARDGHYIYNKELISKKELIKKELTSKKESGKEEVVEEEGEGEEEVSSIQVWTPPPKLSLQGKIAPNLVQRNCYMALQPSKSEQMYPLYVLGPQNIYYYKDIDAQPIEFSLESAPKKKMLALQKNIEKNRAKLITLNNDDLKTITNFTCYIPNELLMTEEEYRAIDDSFSIPEDFRDAKATWQQFTKLTSSLDLFVMAGWAHLQTDVAARYIKADLQIPDTCKILLSCVPGMSINAYKFLTGLKDIQRHPQLYVFQTGIGVSGGFPLLPTLTKESIERSEVRLKWRLHISAYDSYMDETGRVRGDRLIVIYCSKDGPGTSGTKFLQKISKEIVPGDYPVLLIGATKGSDEYQEWEKECGMRGLQSCTAIPRTESSQVLMRGLRDAQYSMATGAYSILEARYLEIGHCAYLCPPHMTQLGNMLEEAGERAIREAFVQGTKALEELSQLPLDYAGHLFQTQFAWHKKDFSEWKLAWEKYLEASLEPSLKVGISEVEVDEHSTGDTSSSSYGMCG